MPNFDQTGPEGQGSLTGRKMGKCSGSNPEDTANLGLGRKQGRRSGRGLGNGTGRGAGRGLGRGAGRGNRNSEV